MPRSWDAERCSERACRLIAPAGPAGARRSDRVLERVAEPAAALLGLRTIRRPPGPITLDVVDQLLYAEAAIADLTGAHATVFYEIAIRQCAGLPVALLCEAGEAGRLPLDLPELDVIDVSLRERASVDAAVQRVVAQVTGGDATPLRGRLERLERYQRVAELADWSAPSFLNWTRATPD